jgi:uncharacterized membrane protein
MEQVWGTILLRPYVFAFLAVYVLGASLQFGPRTALGFLPLGYLIAFLSEFSSIHCGFPYGHYYYIPTTLGQEVWVLGVPLMDSLSYVFLAACSYATALFLLSPMGGDRDTVAAWRHPGTNGALGPWVLGGVLMVLLDVVIDPVALRGEQWFLGQIYGYWTPGRYFGIPMSNFGGWLLVALVMVKVLQTFAGQRARDSADPPGRGFCVGLLWGPALYLSVLLFNVTVTFAIGEVSLGIASSSIVMALVVVSAVVTLYKLRPPMPSMEQSSLLRDNRGRQYSTNAVRDDGRVPR